MVETPQEKEKKITLPESLQRAMVKFFLKTSLPKIATDNKGSQQTSLVKAKGN